MVCNFGPKGGKKYLCVASQICKRKFGKQKVEVRNRNFPNGKEYEVCLKEYKPIVMELKVMLMEREIVIKY